MLYAKRLDLWYWVEVAQTAAYVLNQTSSKMRKGHTLYELWWGRELNVSHLCVFRSLAYAHIPKEFRKKLISKSLRRVFVGYSTNSKGYRLWDPKRKRISICKDVLFDGNATYIDALKPLGFSLTHNC